MGRQLPQIVHYFQKFSFKKVEFSKNVYQKYFDDKVEKIGNISQKLREIVDFLILRVP